MEIICTRCTFALPAHLHIADNLFNQDDDQFDVKDVTWQRAQEPTLRGDALRPFCLPLLQPALTTRPLTDHLWQTGPRVMPCCLGMNRTVAHGRVTGQAPNMLLTKLLLAH